MDAEKGTADISAPAAPKISKPEVTAERLRQVLSYCPETGEFRWNWIGKFNRFVGKVAGCTNGHGYRIILVDGRIYGAHRLAWMYVHGAFPAHQVDHINGIRTDNRIANLREATVVEKVRNKALQSNNKSGYKGVSLKDGKWRACICRNGKNTEIGRYDSAVEAARAYDDAALVAYGRFARLNFQGDAR